MVSQEEFEASIAWSRVVVGCVVKNEQGQYLLVQEAQESAYGLWNLPAGHVDRGESIEDAAVRETKEEAGVDVELINKIGIWHEAVEEPVRHAFAARIIGGIPQPQEGEILAVKWFSFSEITQMRTEGKLRVEWIYEALTIVESS